MRKWIKWILWAVGVQVLLINLSAALYAWRLTHFDPLPATAEAGAGAQNPVARTWRLFTGPRLYRQPPVAAPAFPVQEVRFPLPDGTPISAWYAPVPGERGCVVLLHGLMANRSYMLPEASELRRMGYSVLLPDLRAHGRSGGRATAMGRSEWEEASAAHRFAAGKGSRNIIYYGVSMGAVAVLRAAAGNGVRPSAVVADLPFASLQEHLEARARLLGFPGQPFAALVTFWIGAERGWNGFRHCTPRYAAEAKVPVLLQWGGRDAWVDREESARIAAALDKGGRSVEYPHAGHGSLFQQDPEEWKRQMTAFLPGAR